MTVLVAAVALLLPAAAGAASWCGVKDATCTAAVGARMELGEVRFCRIDANGCDAFHADGCLFVRWGFDGDDGGAAGGTASAMPQVCNTPDRAGASNNNCKNLLASSMIDSGVTTFWHEGAKVLRATRTAAPTGGEAPILSAECVYQRELGR